MGIGRAGRRSWPFQAPGTKLAEGDQATGLLETGRRQKGGAQAAATEQL